MENINNINKNFICNKNIYIENLRKNFKNSLEILNKIKNNYSQSYINFNGIHQPDYLSLLSIIKTLKKQHLEIILLLLSPSTFAKPIEIIKKNIDSNYHIIFNKSIIKYNITCHCLAKQFNCQAQLNIFKLDDKSHIIEDYTCKLSITLDLNNSEPVLFNLLNFN